MWYIRQIDNKKNISSRCGILWENETQKLYEKNMATLYFRNRT